jgi:polyhydroxybutyrate depolymerase
MIMKKYLLAITILLSTLSFHAQTTVVDSILSGGIYRNYRLYVPAMYTGATARPLIINLHGYTSNALQQQYYSNFGPIADTANFLMVFPNGTFSSGQQYWNAGLYAAGVDDIGFLSHLIDSLKLQYNINLNRVYATGMSNGGFMSHTLACELSNRITAIASVTGSIFTTQYGSYCHPTRPVPVMQIHGTSDATVPYAGSASQYMEPIDTVVKYWVTKNNCNPTAAFTNVPNTSTTDNCTAEHYVYSGGNLGSTVEFYKIIGGGHSWPGAPYNIPGINTNQDFTASKEIWRFFNQYNLASLTNIEDIEKQNLAISVYPNPANTILNFNTDNFNNSESIEITDLLGKVVLSDHTNSTTINIEKLQPGIYFLSIKNGNNKSGKAKFIKE